MSKDTQDQDKSAGNQLVTSIAGAVEQQVTQAGNLTKKVRKAIEKSAKKLVKHLDKLAAKAAKKEAKASDKAARKAEKKAEKDAKKAEKNAAKADKNAARTKSGKNKDAGLKAPKLDELTRPIAAPSTDVKASPRPLTAQPRTTPKPKTTAPASGKTPVPRPAPATTTENVPKADSSASQEQ